MRVELVNPYGGKLTVDESRKEEYIARGFTLASAPVSVSKAEEPKTEKKRKSIMRKKA